MSLLLSIPAAAAELSIGKRTLERLLAEKQLVPVRIGSRVLLEPGELARFIRDNRETAPSVAPANPISTGQRGAIHARADELDRATSAKHGTTKAAIKTWASQAFGRPIESVNDLSYNEASDTLDELAARLENAGER